MKVLVFPCGSEIGLEVYRSLKYEKDIELYGGSSVLYDPGRLVYENYFNSFPYIDHPDFLSYLNQFVIEHQIDIIYPAMDSVILTMAKSIKDIKCKVITANHAAVEICMSKSQTYKHLKGRVNIPKTIVSPSINEFPVFVKPDFGYGGKGAQRVRDVEELKYVQKNRPDLIVLEYLPGREFTVDCFTDYNGELLFVGARERKRITNGISGSTAPVYGKKYNEIALIINANLQLNGAWFFQVKEDRNGQLSLLEIAPRIAGVSGLYRNLGINLPLLNIYNLLCMPVNILANDFNIEIEKSFVSLFKISFEYYDVYIDLDDTIIVKGEINLSAIRFIYQCINEDCSVTLITRHAGDLYNLLKKHKIDSIFDEIIWIKDQKPKSEFIKKEKSIFIDDSFAERKEVKENLNIPVFSVDAIECLLK